MPRGSPAQTEARKEKIIEVCARIYETMSFKEIAIRKIGSATGFTRTSFCNYFENVITGTVAAIYEYPTDTTRAVLNMMAHQIMTRFPNIRFVVPHCGSFLPYMLQRFSGVSGILASMGMMEQVDAQAEFSQLWFDIAGDPEPAALDILRMAAPEDHIVFGSDYPHSPASVILKKKAHFDSNPKYDDIRQTIYAENAIRLLQSKGGLKA